MCDNSPNLGGISIPYRYTSFISSTELQALQCKLEDNKRGFVQEGCDKSPKSKQTASNLQPIDPEDPCRQLQNFTNISTEDQEKCCRGVHAKFGQYVARSEVDIITMLGERGKWQKCSDLAPIFTLWV